MVNNVDPEQTCSSRSSMSWVYNVCQCLSVGKLRIVISQYLISVDYQSRGGHYEVVLRSTCLAYGDYINESKTQ